MDNAVVTMLFVGIGFIVFLTMGGAFNLRRLDRKALEELDALSAVSNHAWSFLTPAQREELADMEHLRKQEEWLEKHVDGEVLNGKPSEKVLIELANRGFIKLGTGTFKRHATALDYLDLPQNSPPVDNTEQDTPEDVDNSVETAENKPVQAESGAEGVDNLPVSPVEEEANIQGNAPVSGEMAESAEAGEVEDGIEHAAQASDPDREVPTERSESHVDLITGSENFSLRASGTPKEDEVDIGETSHKGEIQEG